MDLVVAELVSTLSPPYLVYQGKPSSPVLARPPSATVMAQLVMTTIMTGSACLWGPYLHPGL